MADNIKIAVQVSDGGSAGKTTKNIKNVKDVLDQTTVSANAASKAIGAMNTTQAGGRATTAKIKQATGGVGQDERGMYAAQRGAIGTGAAGRDFSKESQGLGGLVRLYATFAANIYAVGAAFNALSQAMDTTNMVKGLDQLGAAQGRNLGSLAKQLVGATDGAISLRDALTATAQASSSGMSNEAILKLGNVAKKASQALGVAMPDAISRLSRGITKIEPELLDELGIFVKIDKATEDYARTVGKSASTLTDFERRQAFANAVLEEGARKFAAIDIETNPYEKIAATFQNLIQSGLELVNKVLTPITSLFASSPTALGIAIALFAKSLAGQALPILGKWKTGLADAAEAARQNVIATNKARQSLVGDISEKTVLDAVEAKKAALDRVDAGVARLQKVKGFAKTASLIPAGGLDDESVKALEARSKAINDSYTKGQALTEKTIAAKKREEAAINGVTSAYREQAAQEVKLQKILDENQTKISRSISLNAAANRIADAAAAKSQRVNIVSSVAGEVSARGVSGSFEELNRQIALAKQGKDALGAPFEDGQKKMSIFNAGLTRTIGTVTILTSAFGTMINSLGTLAFIIGILVTVFELVDKFASTSAKESKAFNDSIDTLDSSIANVSRTIDNINTKKLIDFFSVESTQAKTNALTDLSDSVTSSVTKFQKLADAQSTWDKNWDSIFSFFGKGSGDKLADGLSQSIISGISTIESPEAKAKFQASIKEILNVKDVDVESIKSLKTAFEGLTSDQRVEAGKRIAESFNQVKESSAKSTNNLVGFKDALVEGAKLVDSMNASLKPTDNIGKVGDVLINASFKLNEALKDPVNAFTAIKELVNNTKVLSLLPPDEGMRLAGLRNEFNKLAEDSAQAEKNLNEVVRQRIKLQEELNNKEEQKNVSKTFKETANPVTGIISKAQPGILALAETFGSQLQRKVVDLRDALPGGRSQADIQKNIAATKVFQEAQEKRIRAYDQEKANLVDREQKTILNTYIAGTKAMEISLKNALAEAAIVSARGYLSIIAGAGADTSMSEANLKQQELRLQIRNIEAIFDNSMQLKRLNLAVEKDTNSRDIARLKEERKSPELSRLEADRLSNQIERLESRQRVIGIVEAGIPSKAKGQAATTITAGRGNMGAAGQGASYGTSGVSEQERAAAELGSWQAEKMKVQGDMAKLFAQINLIEDAEKKIVIPIRQAAKLEKDRLEYAGNSVARKAEEAIQISNIIGEYNSELQLRKNISAEEALLIKYQKEQVDLLADQQILGLVINAGKLKGQDLLDAENGIIRNGNRLREMSVEYDSNLVKLKNTQFYEDIKNNEDLRKKEVARQEYLAENSRQIELAKISARDAELGYLSTTGRISEKALANAQYDINLLKQKIEYSKEVSKVETDRINLEIEAKNKLAALEKATPKTIQKLDIPSGTISEAPNPAFVEGERIITEQKERQNALLDSQKEKLDAANVARTKAAQLTRDAQLETAATNKRLEEQVLVMEKIQSIAKTLSDVFGETGQKIAGGIQAITSSLQDYTNKRIDADKKYAKDRLDIENQTKADIKKIEDTDGFGFDSAKPIVEAKERETAALTKLDDDYTNKSKRMSVDRDIAVVNSAKNMFKEKTGAYRALNAIERVMHVQKMFMMALELKTELLAVGKTIVAAFAGETQKTAATVGGVAARNTAKVPGIFGTFVELLGPFGFAAAALAIAAIGISKSGGPKVTGDFTPTSEQKQKVAGTGQKYDNSGKLVSRAGGVPTDDTARAESVVKSLSYMEENMSETTKLSNKMLEALKGIKDNTEGLASALLTTFRGPNAGSFDQFGKTGTIKEGIGSNRLAAAGIGAILGGPIGIVLSQIPIVGKAISSIFGGATTRDVKDFGIAVKGTVQEIALGTESAIRTFADIETKRKGGWFRKDRITNETLFEEANNAIKGYVSSIFTNYQSALKEAGKVLGRDTTLTDSIINTTEISFRLSAKGISGDELTKAIQGEISIAVNEAAAAAFPELEKFKKPFEEAGQTVLRLATNMVVLKDSLSNLGIVLPVLAETITSTVTPKMQEDLGIALAKKTAAQAEFNRVSGTVGQTITETVSTGEGSIGGYGEYTQEVTRTISTAEDATKAQTDLTKAIADYDKQAAIVAQAEKTRTTNNIAYSQKFVDLNDDIETLSKRLNTYASSILTTGQRTQATQSKYLDLVNELDASTGGALKGALANVKSKAEFDNLFKASLASGTDAGLAMATALLKITPLYVANTEALEKYSTALDDQKIKMGALGVAGGLSPDLARSIQREREITKITEEYTEVQAEVLITNQRAIWQKEDEISATKRSISLLQAQGRSYDALIKSRELEILGMDALTAANQLQINATNDANKTRELEIELAVAQGNSQVALNHARSKELDGLSASDRIIKQATFDRIDANKSRELEVELYKLQGNAQLALNHTRSKELDLLSAKDRITKQAIFDEQDRLDLRSREATLMSTQGFSYAALLIQRELELNTLTQTQRAYQVMINAAEDANKTQQLNIELMEAGGDTLGALYANRVNELKALSLTDQAIKIRIWNLQDEAKVNELNIDLLEASGNVAGALYARRVQELKAMTRAQQEIKIRIWLLEDEAKILSSKNAQEIRIYELLGNASMANTLRRKAELEAMDAALRPGQLYIYALEDQQSIYEKLKNTITNTTSSLRNSIQALKDYQLSLKTGDKTILKPEQVYTLKKQEFFNLKAIAESVATNPTEEAAQAAAISKLPAAADSFLESSRTLFASSQTYTDDFNLVESSLTSLTKLLTGQLSDAEKSLNELKAVNESLGTISENTESMAELMSKFIVASGAATSARAAAGGAGYGAAGGSGTFNTGASAGVPGVQSVSNSIPGVQSTTTNIPRASSPSPSSSGTSSLTLAPGATGTSVSGAETTRAMELANLLASLSNNNQKTVYQWYMKHPYAQKNPNLADINYWVTEGIDKWAAEYGIDSVKREFSAAVSRDRGIADVVPINRFAKGGLASGVSLVGEEGPEIVDFNTPARVYPAGQTTAMLANNTALVNEIKALRQEVEKLRSEQKEQTGHLITTNYDANRAAAEMVAKVTEQSSKESAWANRSAARVV